ncbi:class I SAM-dependent methyltransferase [Gallaecimonas sp. GXIMD1310]|uniref:class I SAM-dependent methyltransferase n=1 Tax=Gallaecimonas sp. GXIMD1310 TaxID=3131926 RepID=UPI00324F00A4
MWNDRFAVDHYVYGTEPNGFLADYVQHLPTGKVLSIGEGEGRNSVFLARQGHQVSAIDGAENGRKKALALASAHGVSLDYRISDLAEAELGDGHWHGIVNIFCHLPPELMQDVHSRIVTALAPGGVYLAELYHPEQLAFGTGGPKNRDWLLSLAELQAQLPGLEWLHARELERDVIEGELHTGRAAVTQIVARKPA